MEEMKIMDSKLEEAAVTGNMGILRQCLKDCQANNNYSDILSRSDKKREEVGNIMHLAAWNVKAEFFKEAIIDLSNHQLVEKLLCYQEGFGDYPGYNPLHVAASVGSLDMVQAITGYYNSKYPNGSYKNLPVESKPWLATDSEGSTPLHIALQDNQDCAMELLSLDLESLCDSLDDSGNSPLFLAVRKGYNQVAKQILDSTPRCIDTGENGFFTALHYAPNCSSVDVCTLLIKKEVEKGQHATHKSKMPMLHKWIELKKASLLFMQLNDENNTLLISDEIKTYLVNLISKCDHNNINAFHLFARDQNMKDSKIIADFYNKHKGEDEKKDLPPWLKQNTSLATPLHLALKHVDKKTIQWLKDTYGDTAFKPTEVGPLIHAAHKRKYTYAERIGDILVQYGWLPFCPNGNKIWQVQGDNRTDVQVAKWLVLNLPNFIPKEEAAEALNYASKQGYNWLVESVLKEHPSVLKTNPLTWKEACTKGYYTTIVAFIENCSYFRELCLEHNTSPLHHVKFEGYEEYRKLVENPVIKGLRNFQDEKGASPLHHAIDTENIQLTEVLLNIDDVSRTLENKDKKTPMHLLHALFKKDKDKKSEDQRKWHTMCIRNGITPGLNIKYFRDKPNVYEVRNTLSVVAALLATITFTAGFTIPGGFDQNKGDALLGDKAAFIVFILSDAFAMFSSFLMLVTLMWSMICDHAKSLILIDRSVYILLAALVTTVVAFMTGVYVVLRNKCLWVAIFIIVLCCVFFLAIYRPVVNRLLDRWGPKDVHGDIEQGQGTISQEDYTTTTGQTASIEEDCSSSIYKKLSSILGVRQSQQGKSD